LAQNDSSLAFDDDSWQPAAMSASAERILLHLGRSVRRPIELRDIYFLEATGETTLVRLRSSRPLRDVRSLGEMCAVVAPFGVLRVHRNHAVNVSHIAEIRRRDSEADWEVTLAPPVNRVLPVSRASLKRLWAAFGER
jgi:DNA-binding LytR/AlgR family response regulator